MSLKKVMPELIPFDGGLWTDGNVDNKTPNCWIDALNFIVARPNGFLTGYSEGEHIAQSRPPMKSSFDSSFDIAIAASETEVKPLVGQTAAPTDTITQNWQSIALCLAAESWVPSISGPPGTIIAAIDATPGLTASDGNDIRLQFQIPNGGSDFTFLPIGTSDAILTASFANGLTQGNIGNLATKIYVDYRIPWKTEITAGGALDPFVALSPIYPANSLYLMIGIDENNYLRYDLPVWGGGDTPPTIQDSTGDYGHITTHYGVGRYSIDLRAWTLRGGGKSFGELISNIKFVRFLFRQQNTNLGLPSASEEIYSVDHVRLDVDYQGFFGDFTSGQPYKQVTIDTLDLNSALAKNVWTLDPGFYKERRLSIGNGSLAFENDGGGILTAQTSIDPIDITNGLPTTLLIDYRVENKTNATAVSVFIGTNNSNYYVLNLPISNGNHYAYLDMSDPGSLTKVGNPYPADLEWLAIQVTVDGVAEPNTTRLYFNNIRLAPYVVGAGFSPRSGNIREGYIYDPTDVSEDSRFIMSCGDALFASTSLLSANCFFIEAGFNNYNPLNCKTNFESRFVFTTATNKNYIGTLPGEPKNLCLLVNGVDGYFELDIYKYPLVGGGTYSYPRFSRVNTTAYKSVIIHQDKAVLSGDPANPNRLVFSDDNDPTTFTLTSFIELDVVGRATKGDSITANLSFEQYLVTFRHTDIYITTGDSIDNYSTRPTSSKIGALSQYHVCQAMRRIFFAGFNGLYEFAAFTDNKISEKIHSLLQTADYDKVKSATISFNPIREILVYTMPTDYENDPATTTVKRYTYSLSKQAFGYINGEVANPRYYSFCSAYYGGGANIPKYYEFGTTLLEWDNGPDINVTVASQNLMYLRTIPFHFHLPYQEKIFDKYYFKARQIGQSLYGPSFGAYLSHNSSYIEPMSAGGNTWLSTDQNEFAEIFFGSGSQSKVLSVKSSWDFPSTGATSQWDWTKPVLLETWGVSFYPGEEL